MRARSTTTTMVLLMKYLRIFPSTHALIVVAPLRVVRDLEELRSEEVPGFQDGIIEDPEEGKHLEDGQNDEEEVKD